MNDQQGRGDVCAVRRSRGAGLVVTTTRQARLLPLAVHEPEVRARVKRQATLSAQLRTRLIVITSSATRSVAEAGSSGGIGGAGYFSPRVKTRRALSGDHV